MSRTAIRYRARCIQCPWTDETEQCDLEARRHTGEGALGKKPGPKHSTVVEGVPA